MSRSDNVRSNPPFLEKVSIACWGLAGVWHLLIGLWYFGAPSFVWDITLGLFRSINQHSVFLYIYSATPYTYAIMESWGATNIRWLLMPIIGIFCTILCIIKVKKFLSSQRGNVKISKNMISLVASCIVGFISFVCFIIPGVFALTGAAIDYYKVLTPVSDDTTVTTIVEQNIIKSKEIDVKSLEALGKLKEQEIITEEEFQVEKNKLLSNK